MSSMSAPGTSSALVKSNSSSKPTPLRGAVKLKCWASEPRHEHTHSPAFDHTAAQLTIEALEMEQHKPLDYVGVGLAIVTGILALIVVAAHVYLASIDRTDTIVTLLLNLLALTFSTIFTVWLGRWSAQRENKAFIRAALRTTYGLHEGLDVAERAAMDGIARMKSRSTLPNDVGGELWEEVFGRVLDQIRGQMRRAQETVANWRELLPEEVDKLSRAEEQKATAINEVSLAVEQARSVLRQIGNSPDAPDTVGLRARIESLEQEKSRISASSAFAAPATGEARRLLAMGAVEEAIAAYSSLIEVSPTAHSPLLGRARARYLAGDKEGALADLKAAEDLCPTDPAIVRMRTEIQAGRGLPPAASIPAVQAWRAPVERGNRALQAGDGEAALKAFLEARSLGLLPVFAAINEAMAFAIMDKGTEVQETIAFALPEMTGPFVRVQGLALLALGKAIQGTDASTEIADLNKGLQDLRLIGRPFSVADSALQSLVLGLRQTNRFEGAVREVFVSLLPSPPS